MTEAVVTGGAGFIGSHLCEALLNMGASVTAVDNLSTGSESNIAPFLVHPNFRFVEADVVEDPLDIAHADLIFHLASPASVPDYLARPLQTLRVNSFGTARLLDLARQTGARFLFASTSEIYGDPLVHPQTETYWGNVNPSGPRACYDESKRFGEVAVLEYHRVYGLDTRVVRIFNTYGPRSRPDDGRIIPNFVTQALRHEAITVYGDGTQTRSLCYVTDLVDGLLAAMLTPDQGGQVFNLGNPVEYTVLEIAQIVSEVVGSDAGIVHRPLPVDDPTRRCPDITRARAILGWQPRVSVDEGLHRTVDWFRTLTPETAEV